MDLKRLTPHSFSFPAARAALLCLCVLIAWSAFTYLQTRKTLESVKNTSAIFSSGDRVLIFAPHPDDETIAAGGLIHQAASSKISVRVAFLTHGDNNAWSYIWENKLPPVTPKALRDFGEQRRIEAITALTSLGVAKDDVTFLGFPDFHLLSLFRSGWDPASPKKSTLTRVSAVPYDNAMVPGSAYTATNLLAQIKDVIVAADPTVIVLAGGHPADFNPDHRALYLFVRVALRELDREKTRLFPALIHYPRWPMSSRPDDPLLAPKHWEGTSHWTALTLSSADRAAKDTALTHHASQFRTSAKYFRSFVRRNELFGDFIPLMLPQEATIDVLTSARATAPTIQNRLTRLVRGSSKTSLSRNKDGITVSIVFDRPLGKQTAATVDLFGISTHTPFAHMPKLTVRLGNLGYTVYDGAQTLPDRTVRIKRRLFSIHIFVPHAAMNNPDTLLLGVNAHFLSAAPMDLTSWRVIALPKDQK
jgi:LmbE family N-acetylglucosaminyl deacetylase